MKLPNSPSKRIYLALLLMVVAFTIAYLPFGGSVFFAILLPLAVVLGPFMVFAFPFSFSFKLTYACGLLFSALLMVLGYKNRQKVFGQITVIAGICLWTFCGLIGLGTAT